MPKPDSKLFKVFAAVAPGAAARYVLHQRALDQAMRLYDAAQNSDFRPIRGDGASGDVVAAQGHDRLVNLARYLDENHDIASAVLDDLTNNTVGARGIEVDPLVRTRGGELHEDFNRALRDLFDEWSTSPETTGERDGATMDRDVARQLYRDGEVFVRRIRSPVFKYRTSIAYVADVLECDYCPIGYIDQARGIYYGIERNQWGAPVNYHFYKTHPGNNFHGFGVPIASGGYLGQPTISRRAGAVLHPKLVQRAKQSRGITALHNVLTRLSDIKDYEESERIAAKVAGDITAYIKKNDAYQGGEISSDGTRRQFEMGAGQVWDLLPGEDVGTVAHSRPNTAIEAFTKHMLRAVAAGTSTRYSSIARDYNGTYSAQRQELVEGAVRYRALFQYLVGSYKRPIWRDFVETVTLSGRLALPRDLDFETLLRAEFRPPALPWIDPLKEAQAWAALVDNEFESHAGVIRARGLDPQKVFDEIAAERAAGIGQAKQQTPPAADNADNGDGSNNESGAAAA